MSELKKNGLEQLSDETLSQVAGGMSRNLAAAYDVMANKYGVGWEVQHLVNGLAYGYDAVAKDVIAGKYGNNQVRINALAAAGYNASLVQDIVNNMLA